MPRTKEPFFKAFKKFITKGNVLDMAVGVVVGGSFSKIVNGLVNYIINPFVGIFIKGGSLDSIKTIIHPAVEEVVDEVTGEVITAASAEVAILWGTWFQTILDFLIVSICIFTMVRLIVRLREALEHDKMVKEEEKAKEAAEKAAAEKAIADAAAAEKAAELAKKQEALDASIIKQAELLAEIRDLMKNK
jgi:large conductance mechanosensitive channel